MTVCVFDYAGLWSARYPELVAGGGTSAMASEYFLDACDILDNSDASPVPDPDKRLRFLNMLVAHLAALYAPLNGQEPVSLVGRISTASMGSVSVSTDMASQPASAAWFQSTKYGAQFWQATNSLRTMRYIPGRQPQFDRPGFGGSWRR